MLRFTLIDRASESWPHFSSVVRPGEVLTFGTTPPAVLCHHLAIRGEGLSPDQLVIWLHEGTYYAADLSMFGSLLNGRQMLPRGRGHAVEAGDVITFGTYEVVATVFDPNEVDDEPTEEVPLLPPGATEPPVDDSGA